MDLPAIVRSQSCGQRRREGPCGHIRDKLFIIYYLIIYYRYIDDICLIWPCGHIRDMSSM